MNGLLDGIKYRFDHPVFGVFASFFAVINYEIFLILFSSESVYSKMYIIGEMTHNPLRYALPLLFTIFWFIFSFIVSIAYEYYEGLRERLSVAAKSMGVGDGGNSRSVAGKAISFDRIKEDMSLYYNRRAKTYTLFSNNVVPLMETIDSHFRSKNLTNPTDNYNLTLAQFIVVHEALKEMKSFFHAFKMDVDKYGEFHLIK